ncbi:molybdenum cofactor guanylyltransferase [Humibacillus xanthopallidus]|uniref:molybdenum cofactor guanylyltransferase n=1 Tax=Humibacillus xanthopallidus TaxID=412689 RepID=UPI001C8ABD0A|nr:molybdenum cofactor guanylyltransferase [Humibacillus xanthopallidus]
MEPSPPVLPYAVSVLVLTGGASRRMGSHKPSLEVGDLPMVVRVLEAARPRPVLVVGRGDDVPGGIPVLVEDPPGGGPVAAIAAGVRHLPGETDVVVVLAADLPFVTSGHLDRLASAAMTGAAGATGGAVTVDPTGRRNWLCSAWPRTALAAALDRLGDPSGRSMRDLAAGLRPAEVADTDGVADDVDTPDDLVQARERVAGEGSPT